MSEHTNNKGSKRAAIKGLLKKTFGRNTPHVSPTASSTNISSRNSSQAELSSTTPSRLRSQPPANPGTLSSVGTRSSDDVNTRPITPMNVGNADTLDNVAMLSATSTGPSTHQVAAVGPGTANKVAETTGSTTGASERAIAPGSSAKIITTAPARATVLPSSAIAPPYAIPSTVATVARMAVADGAGSPGGVVPEARHDALTLSPGAFTESSPSAVSRAKDKMFVTLEGMATIAQGLYDCSDVFLPLKAAAGIFLTIYKNTGIVIGNRATLEELQLRLKAILGIVTEYMDNGASERLKIRIQLFCSAIDHQLKDIKHLSDHSLARRIAEGSKDAQDIAKAIGSINILCNIFQMDTQLHFGTTALEKLSSGVLAELYQSGTSYDARHSSYGEVGGCMPGTRVKILDDLTIWAFDPTKAKIYWLVGMAGTGKSTIVHSFCEILEAHNMLGASFFCSRASSIASNAGCIIPGIAYHLANSSPAIKTRVVEAIEQSHQLVEPTYWSMSKQFQALISRPIQACVKSSTELYKVIVIDALDECSDQKKAAEFVRTVLSLMANIPLKILVASREEIQISAAFNSLHVSPDTFFLHNIEHNIVKNDIHKYLLAALNLVHQQYDPQANDNWPSSTHLSLLLEKCGVLFIYASTIVRYIEAGEMDYNERLMTILSASPESTDNIQNEPIDLLYMHILEQACVKKDRNEIAAMRKILSAILFLDMPLTASGIEQLLSMKIKRVLGALKAVIFVHKDEGHPVTIFHASFPDFVTSPDRCTSAVFPAISVAGVQEMLTLHCLNFMNSSLKFNICEVPDRKTCSGQFQTNPENNGHISEGLAYACTHWASHLSKVSEKNDIILDALEHFLTKHLLHWFECLSIIQMLETSIHLLQLAESFCMRTKLDNSHGHLAELVNDARHTIQAFFQPVKNHCFEIYNSALVWLPKSTCMKQIYDIPKVPQVTVGLADHWNQLQINIVAKGSLRSATYSPDGRYVAAGSKDKTIWVWDAYTGQMQLELQGHTDRICAVAYSPDGRFIASGSNDKTVKIWDVSSGQLLSNLTGHSNKVITVAYSPDGKFIASGSHDSTIRIWDTNTMQMLAMLEGHGAAIWAIAYSPDGSHIASGSDDSIVKIWNVHTQQLLCSLQGHTGDVRSVAYSPDGKYVASGSNDSTIKIWNVSTKEMQAQLQGHTDFVSSVAYSSDGKFIASGSADRLIKIWNVNTKQPCVELQGHTNVVWFAKYLPNSNLIASVSSDKTVKIWNTSHQHRHSKGNNHTNWVYSIACAPPSQLVVSGSLDHSAKIWDTSTGELLTVLKDHTDQIFSVVFSSDGKFIASGSLDRSIEIWDTKAKHTHAVLKGHLYAVRSVTFSPNGEFVASGSNDKTIKIWDISTEKMEIELNGHMDRVCSVVYSPNGEFIASGSEDKTVKVWNASTGQIEANLTGHKKKVTSVAYSPDGKYIVSGSEDTTVILWDVSNKHMQAELNSHTDIVQSAFFSPDGSHIVSLSEDKTIKLWNVSQLKPTKQVDILSTTLWDFGKGWLMLKDTSYWIPIHDVISFTTCGKRMYIGTRSGQVVVLDFGTSVFAK